MTRIIFFAAVFSLISLASAAQEPGEGGLDDAQACSFGLENYMGKRIGGWERPCDESNYEFLMSRDNHCSQSIKRQATAYREKQCGRSAVKKPAAASHCVTPPPGQTQSDPALGRCVVAKNTNTLPQCKYSFTYDSSISGNGLGGGVVDPGKTGKACTARPGEVFTFNKWTAVPGSAK
jgi:hypothetical protein